MNNRIWLIILLLSAPHASVCAAPKSVSLWEGFSDQMKATLPLVLATSTSNVVVQAVLPPITQLLTTVVATCSFMVRVGQKGFNRLCNRPNPLQAHELHIWEQVIENVTGTLCEQSIAGTIMLKNVPRIADDTEHGSAARDHWHYYVQFVSKVFEHNADYLESKIPYYAATKEQQRILVAVADSLSLEDRAGIVFMLTMIVSNLRHLVHVCKTADSFEHVDVEHVKKVSRNTLLIMKKLREMIGSSYDQKHQGALAPAVAMPVTTSGKVPGY
jgi:hypothetical protein